MSELCSGVLMGLPFLVLYVVVSFPTKGTRGQDPEFFILIACRATCSVDTGALCSVRALCVDVRASFPHYMCRLALVSILASTIAMAMCAWLIRIALKLFPSLFLFALGC